MSLITLSPSTPPPSFSPWFKLPSLILCFSHSTSSLTTPPALTLSPHPPLPFSPPVCNHGCEVSGQRKCSHISKGSWVLSGSSQEKEKVKLNTVGEDGGMRAELWGTVINTSSREAAVLKGHQEEELMLCCFVLHFLREISFHGTSLLFVNVLQSTIRLLLLMLCTWILQRISYIFLVLNGSIIVFSSEWIKSYFLDNI